MSRIGRHKDRYGSSNEFSRNNSNEGTAARTRPFSVEEIMLRRKNKKVPADAKEGAGEPGDLSVRDNVKSASDYSDSDGGHKPMNDKAKDISRKKKENTSKKEEAFLKGKGNRDSEANLKVKSSTDKRSKDKRDNSEKRSHHRSRMEDRLRDDIEIESERRQSKDFVVKDKYGDRDKKSQRESKRKHHSGNDEKSRSEIDGSALKKHDSERWKDTEFSERKGRKKESSQPHYEEARPKRRWSRSREHDGDRDRRSSSVSPRPHKRGSHHGREHGESSFHSLKDRPGRQHSDADKGRTSSNGGHSSGHYRRHGGHSSGLGGYSPRKRRTEAAIKTPSPTTRSPERKNAAWDLPPVGKDGAGAASMPANFQSPHQVVSSNMHELPTVGPLTSNIAKPQSTSSPNIISTIKDISIDSIQLTQATKPMRRLYVENIPASSSDKAVMECLNDFLLSLSVNHVQGTRPCISCIINKEKGQALVEFLTPEYATLSLAFDGRSFSGSILKIRRPKDFIETTTVIAEKPVATIPEKPVAVAVAISDIVKDSPHKIFIGGISKALSANMLMEIVSAFGLLKAYRFEVNTELNEPFAFLEYVDQSITLKACAGLNGMKLAGKVLTVVQAFPDELVEEPTERPPFYGVPEHVKPLLEKPTQVLRLKNVFNLEESLLLSEPELEETLEDIRLECARFGTVKSVNIVRFSDNHVVVPEAFEINDNSTIQRDLQNPDKIKSTEHANCEPEKNNEGKLVSVGEPKDIGEPQDVGEVASIGEQDVGEVVAIGEPQGIGEVLSVRESNDIGEVMGIIERQDDGEVAAVGEPQDVGEIAAIGEPQDVGEVAAVGEPHGIGEAVEDIKSIDDKPINDLRENESSEPTHLDSSGATKDHPQIRTSENQPSCSNRGADFQVGDSGQENGTTQEDPKPELADGELQNACIELNEITVEKIDVDNINSLQKTCDLDVFEQGCVLVEYVRKEAASSAAHCLHGRIYGDRIVAAGYVPHDLYRLRFPR
ncbi:RNA-binding (RRM/RBD/RNP motifs) family protein isoform X2 [Tasmannia lanceolata]|uniref:RNA-binding (RRM/RBD/RNP motifs) family protein isoform X2 n=1 Tax=Tasmannia lanceolata TaxID=3420 RepID=UPI004062C494